MGKSRPNKNKREPIDENKIKFFQKALLVWYKKNGRSFPWREKGATNFQLIISEVFLQRTKAETVAKFLPQFFNKYPDWTSLGEASEEELQGFTQPLGLYKQRGTRLYKLAQEIRKRKGDFPKERSQVEEMPMMGQYITNAYELYIIKKRTPLLDVNMARLLERVFGPRDLADIRNDPYLQTLAYRVIDTPNSKELNWGILDYSALICQTNPKCHMCLIKSFCLFFRNLND